MDEATDDDGWAGSAVSFFEQVGWTLFEDHSGVLVERATDEWLRLAENDGLVFGSYNDSIPMGELVVIENGRVVREHRDDPARPSWHVNVGLLPEEGDVPWTSWIDVAGFVDEDEVYAAAPDQVELWLFAARGGAE